MLAYSLHACILIACILIACLHTHPLHTYTACLHTHHFDTAYFDTCILCTWMLSLFHWMLCTWMLGWKCQCVSVSVEVSVYVVQMWWKCQCVSVSVEVSVFKGFSGRTLRKAFGKKQYDAFLHPSVPSKVGQRHCVPTGGSRHSASLRARSLVPGGIPPKPSKRNPTWPRGAT